MCVDGDVELELENQKFSLQKGETVLFPATINHLKIESNHAVILEVFL